MDDVISPVLLCTLAFLLLPQMLSSLPNPTPRSCSDPTRVCTSFLAIKSSPNLTLPLLQSMFDVLPSDVPVDDPTNPDNLFIRKNCSCSPSAKTASYEYITNTTFTVGRGKEGGLVHVVTQAYGPLAIVPNSSRILDSGAVVAVRLLCGCSNGLWNYFVSWIAEIGDSVEILASRFGVRMDDIERTNCLRKKSDLVVGDVYYIPLDSVPGKPYSFKPVVVSPSFVPVPVPVPPSNYPQLE